MAKQVVQKCAKCCSAARAKLAELRELRDQADVADAVYAHPPLPYIPGPPADAAAAKYVKLTDAELADVGLTPRDLKIPLTNFQAAVYRRVDNDALLVAFRGTDKLTDVGADLVQGLNLPSAYYSRAQGIAARMSQALEEAGKPLPTFVGHSLGGGLASAAAWTSGAPASTFNAAGLSGMSKFLGATWTTLFGKAEEVTAMSVKGEVLTTAQKYGSLLIPEAYRTKDVVLDPPAEIGKKILDRYGPDPSMLDKAKAAAIRSGELHKMASVKASLDKAIKGAEGQVQVACGS